MKLFRLFAAAACGLFASVVGSAQTVQATSIYFETGQDALTADARHQLDSVASLLANIPEAYTVLLTGHTDNQGSDAYNKALSERRSQNARAYLAKKGFKGKNITIAWAGFNEPVAGNSTDAGRSQNRRVEIEVAPINVKPAAVFGFESDAESSIIEAGEGGTIVVASGTQITIPPNAFVDADGNPISGPVEVQYEEFRDPIDFILSGLPMSNINGMAGSHFTSAGMFQLKAYVSGAEVEVADGKAIDVQFALEEQTPDWNFYQLDEGTDTWVANNEAAPDAISNQALTATGTAISCRDEVCDLKISSINTGMELAQSDNMISYNDPLECGLCNKLVPFRVGTGSGSTEVFVKKRNRRHFRFEVHSENIWGRGCFGGRSAEAAATKAFNGVQWEAKSTDYNSTDLAVMQNADSVWATHATGQREFTFYFKHKDSHRTVKIEATPFKKYKRKLDTHNQLEVASARWAQYQTETKSVQKRIDRGIESRNNFAIRDCRKKMTCFWEANAEWMTPRERAMEISVWFDWFNENKATMANRYGQLRDFPDQETLECQRVIVEREALQAELQGQSKAQMAARSQTESLFTSLSITNTGIYNCDQMARIQEPVIASAVYKTANGGEIKPISIFVSDSKLNSALEYNGYMDFSPYKFPYGSTSKNTVLAFDASGNAYVCKPNEFSRAMRAQGLQKTIVLELIKPQSEDELRLAMQ